MRKKDALEINFEELILEYNVNCIQMIKNVFISVTIMSKLSTTTTKLHNLYLFIHVHCPVNNIKQCKTDGKYNSRNQ